MRFATLCVALGALILFTACGSSGGSSSGGGSGGPTITSVDANAGSVVGGTAVTITGTDFVTGSTGVTFGGVPAIGINVVSATQLTCVTPAHAAGAVDVAVGTSAGTGTLTNGFTYRPILDAIIGSRNSGTTSGVFIFRDVLNHSGIAADVVLDNAGSQINHGGHIAIWNDWLAVANRGDNSVTIYNGITTLTSGQAPTARLTGMSCPTGLHISAAGDLYVPNRCNNNLFIFRDITTVNTGDGPDATLTTNSCPTDCQVDGTRLFVCCRCTSTNSIQIWDNAAGLVGGEAPNAQLDSNSPRRLEIHQGVLWTRQSSNNAAVFGWSNASSLANGAVPDRAIFGLVPTGDRGDFHFIGGHAWLSNQWNNDPVLVRVPLGTGLVTMPDATIDEDVFNEDACYDVSVGHNAMIATARDSSFCVLYRDAMGFATDAPPDGFLFDVRLSNPKQVILIER